MATFPLFVLLLAVGFYLLKTFFLTDLVVNLGVGMIASILAYVATRGIINVLPKKMIDPKNKAVFITGCDTGFGNELARNLDALGFHVYAGCLFPDKEGACKLKEACSERLRIVQIDVTSDEQVKAAAKEVESTLDGKELWAVVNNAGIATFTEIEWCPVETYQKIIDVNAVGPIRVTKSFLPMLRESRGRVVFVASLAGRYTFPGFSAYSMSKYAIVSFADALRREMKKWGITVHTIEPSLYKTPITALDRMSLILKNAWDSTPAKIQESYGQEYYQAFQQCLVGQVKRARENIDEVVNDMIDGVAGQNPKLRYVPGIHIQIRARILSTIPTELQDYLLCLAQPKCIPAAAKQSSIDKLRPELRRTQSEPVKIKQFASSILRR